MFPIANWYFHIDMVNWCLPFWLNVLDAFQRSLTPLLLSSFLSTLSFSWIPSPHTIFFFLLSRILFTVVSFWYQLLPASQIVKNLVNYTSTFPESALVFSTHVSIYFIILFYYIPLFCLQFWGVQYVVSYKTGKLLLCIALYIFFSISRAFYYRIEIFPWLHWQFQDFPCFYKFLEFVLCWEVFLFDLPHNLLLSPRPLLLIHAFCSTVHRSILSTSLIIFLYFCSMSLLVCILCCCSLVFTPHRGFLLIYSCKLLRFSPTCSLDAFSFLSEKFVAFLSLFSELTFCV